MSTRIEFNLAEIQQEMLGTANNLIIPEEIQDVQRELKQKSVRRIIDLYSLSRKNMKVFKATYDALKDNNPWTRMAAADVICKYGNTNSFEYLFKALEDEQNSKIKQKIANSINKLESRLSTPPEEPQVSLRDAARILSYSD